MIVAIISIIGGILAAAGFIIARKPNAKELIDKVTPYQGWIGIILFIWGVWQTISVILNLGWIGTNLIFWIIWAVVALSNLFVGFLLGFGLISKYALSKNEEAKEKGEKIRLKLLKFQIPLGFISIAIGLLYLFFALGLFMIGYISFAVVIIGYIVLTLVAGNPKTDEGSSQSETPSAPSPKNKNQAAPVIKEGTFYENRIGNVTCVQDGKSYKVGFTITAKKIVTDNETKKEKEDIINDQIEIGMLKDGKEIYLKSYLFTKTITTLNLAIDQKPDKIGIDPYNKLPEKV